MSAVFASFSSTCPECGSAIRTGDPIVFIDDTPIHLDCEETVDLWNVDAA